MERISDLMKKNQEEWFTGRSRELAMLRRQLAGDTGNWKLVHLHGPGGIGKTSLLRSYIRASGRDDVTVTVTAEEFRTPIPFLEELHRLLSGKGWRPPLPEGEADSRLAEYLNEQAAARQGLLLILDSFEECRPIERWLRERWLPMLSVHVRVCMSGRYPLAEEWLREPGWHGLLHQHRLGPLSRRSVNRYMDLRGIADPYARETIDRFAKGIPLALAMACDTVVQYGMELLQEDTRKRRMIQSLCGVLLQDLTDSSLKRLLDAASLVWRFDQDLLEEMTGRAVEDDTFRKLCGLPFITLTDQWGWSMEDAARDWVRTDLSGRSPETCELYRRRAQLLLQGRFASAPAEQKERFIVELLYLHDNEFLRSYGFRGSAESLQAEIRHASERDLPELARIYRAWASSIPPFLPDETHQESYFRAVWEEEPSSFTVFAVGGRLVAFYVLVPFTEAIRTILRSNPIFLTYAADAPRQEKEFLIWLGCAEPDSDASVFGLLLRTLFLELAGKLITTLTPLPYFAGIYASLGFKRLLWADSRYTGDTPAVAYQMDFRGMELTEPLTGPSARSEQQAALNRQEVAALLKKALSLPPSAESEEGQWMALLGLERIKKRAVQEGSAAAGIRKAVSECLDRMNGGTEEEQLQAKTVRLAYLQKVGTHDVVASRLNLSPSTYYRYLKKALDRLAQELSAE